MSRRRSRWLRSVLVVLGAVVVVAFAAGAWLTFDPGILRPLAEYVATVASGRPVTIGALDFRLEEGRTIIEVRQVRLGQTTTERVSISLTGRQSHANGDGVRFPNGSSIDHFRALIELSLTERPRVSTVEVSGAMLVATRQSPSPSAGPPPLARLLVVPRILLGLGLERLVMRTGKFVYRGPSSTRSAGLTAVLDATGDDLAFHGELLVGPAVPSLPFEGTVRDPMTGDWQIDVRLTGDGVPMEGVRFLAGMLEPDPKVRTALDRIANRSRFVLSARLARAQIDSATLDMTFDAPGGSDEAGISLEGIGFLARAVPDPDGWTVNGEVDWSRLPGGGDAERSPFAARWTNDVPGSLRWSAHQVPIPLLAGTVRGALPPGHSLRPTLERLRLAGMIDELTAFGDPGAGDDPSFRMSAAVSGFGAGPGEWRISDTDAGIEFAGGEWRLRFADDRLHAALPSFRSAPYELTLQGEVRVTADEAGWTAHTGGLGFAAAGIGGHVTGSLHTPLPDRGTPPVLDVEIRLDDTALADIGTVLPDRRGGAFTRWYRGAVRSGRLTGATLRIHGDPRNIPFPGGDGEFEAEGVVREVDFAYDEEWPAGRVEEARVRAKGATLEFSGMRGSMFDTSVEDGFVRLPDTTDLAGRVHVSLTGSGPARDLLKFVRASPLGTGDGGPAPDLHVDGPTATAVELVIPYGRDAGERPLDIAGTIALEGIALSLAGRPAVLGEVRGELGFDATSLSGGPLHGHFRGATIESHLAFDPDEGLRLRFSGEGDGEWFGGALEDLVNLGREETEPWLTHLRGRTAWDAEYRSRTGILLRSNLRTAAVDLPAPFAKPVGTVRQVAVVLTPGETRWLIDASYGPDTKGLFEVAETDGEWALTRGAVTLGGTPPTLPAEGHIEISGKLAELGLDPWLALGAGESLDPAGWLFRIGRISLETDGARVLGRPIALGRFELTAAADGSGFHARLDGEGIAGDIVFSADPVSGRLRIHLERAHFGAPAAAGEDEGGESAAAGEDGGDESTDEDSGDDSGGGAQPDRWPGFDVHVDSLRVEKIDLGTVRAIGNRTANGLDIEDLMVDSTSLRMRGRGSWLAGEDGTSISQLEVRMNTDDFSRLLVAAGLDDETATGGTVEIRFDLAWPGSPFEPSLERSEGTVEMDAEKGSLPNVRVGPFGRLFALLSLDALPRVLSLDLSHVFGKGFKYDRITLRTGIEDGSARIREFTITGPSARIEVSGSIDLASRRYDQEVAVIPRITRSGALLPVWATAWPLLIGNFLLEMASGDEIILDRLFRLRYRLQGPLDAPEIERIRGRNSSGEK